MHAQPWPLPSWSPYSCCVVVTMTRCLGKGSWWRTRPVPAEAGWVPGLSSGVYPRLALGPGSSPVCRESGAVSFISQGSTLHLSLRATRMGANLPEGPGGSAKSPSAPSKRAREHLWTLSHLDPTRKVILLHPFGI